MTKADARKVLKGYITKAREHFAEAKRAVKEDPDTWVLDPEFLCEDFAVDSAFGPGFFEGSSEANLFSDAYLVLVCGWRR